MVAFTTALAALGPTRDFRMLLSLWRAAPSILLCFKCMPKRYRELERRIRFLSLRGLCRVRDHTWKQMFLGLIYLYLSSVKGGALSAPEREADVVMLCSEVGDTEQPQAQARLSALIKSLMAT